MQEGHQATLGVRNKAEYQESQEIQLYPLHRSQACALERIYKLQTEELQNGMRIYKLESQSTGGSKGILKITVCFMYIKVPQPGGPLAVGDPERVSKSAVIGYNASINQSIIQSINQSIIQSINQSIIQSINQSFNQSINQSI
ncbi:hypothetical protein BO70DRAFT_216977 [Aspergillus heteromorphus CBS 117.55]|uniref:Uncharacterized protein n=1 Tax=Aspergillus heteromorphus CBS 117.55 TaxID=1448321 RepID=A0A317UR91_9EURO|nr:uncharacterized protein BO70DRAFT_216977 [Aspergillus heteromorphus CBS 117.55]PWY63716.1 hypothetical protein BO70DRAFT_216977 [Aspergillus heteromorphus CBS 117.55]